MKKIIFNLMLFILCFAGALGCVLYASWTKMNDATIDSTPKTLATEDNSLVSLIQNITTAESLGGNIRLTSDSGRTNINGEVQVFNDGELKIQANVNGKFENTKLSINAYYLLDTLYLNYQDLRLSFAVSDTISALSGILNGATGGELSDLLNLETLQSALTDMKTSELSSGGKKIAVTIPYIGDFQIITNAKNVPIFISASNINLNNDIYHLSVNLNTKATTFELDTSIYKNIDINDYSEIITGIVNIISNGGATFKGTLSTPFTTNDIDLELTINDKLEILLNANIDNTNLKLFYSDEKVYLDAFDNLLCVTVEDCLKLIDYYFDEPIKLSLVDTNTLSFDTSIGSFTIGLNIEETNLEDIYFDGEGFAFDLHKANRTKQIEFSTNNAQNVSANNLINTIDKCSKLLSAENYSIEINGTVNNLAFKGNTYFELNKTQTGLNSFAFVGSFNNTNLGLVYTDGYYYFTYADAKVKFSSECVTDLYNYFTQQTTVSYIDFESIVAFIDDITTKLSFSSNSKLSMISGNSEFSILLRDSMTKINANNIKIGENTLTLSANVYADNTSYKIYVNSIEKSSYIDCSKTNDTIKAVTNSSKLSSGKYSGVLSIGIYNCDVFNIKIDVKTTYSNGKFKLVANLSNLPTTIGITKYNSLTYKDHKATLTLENGKISIQRTIQKRFSGSTLTEIDKSYKFNEINVSILQDLIGFSNGTMKTITKNASSPSTNKINLSSLIKGMEIADSSLSVLTKSFGAFGITDFRANIEHKNSYVTSLSLDVAIKELVTIHLTLDKK